MPIQATMIVRCNMLTAGPKPVSGLKTSYHQNENRANLYGCISVLWRVVGCVPNVIKAMTQNGRECIILCVNGDKETITYRGKK